MMERNKRERESVREKNKIFRRGSWEKVVE